MNAARPSALTRGGSHHRSVLRCGAEIAARPGLPTPCAIRAGGLGRCSAVCSGTCQRWFRWTKVSPLGMARGLTRRGAAGRGRDGQGERRPASHAAAAGEGRISGRGSGGSAAYGGLPYGIGRWYGSGRVPVGGTQPLVLGVRPQPAVVRRVRDRDHLRRCGGAAPPAPRPGAAPGSPAGGPRSTAHAACPGVSPAARRAGTTQRIRSSSRRWTEVRSSCRDMKVPSPSVAVRCCEAAAASVARHTCSCEDRCTNHVRRPAHDRPCAPAACAGRVRDVGPDRPWEHARDRGGYGGRRWLLSRPRWTPGEGASCPGSKGAQVFLQ